MQELIHSLLERNARKLDTGVVAGVVENRLRPPHHPTATRVVNQNPAATTPSSSARPPRRRSTPLVEPRMAYKDGSGRASPFNCCGRIS
jgi:hypothetical protein